MSVVDNMQNRWTTGTCKTNKRVYETRSAGKTAAKLLAKKGYGNLRPYICPHCDEWHIGHQNYWRKDEQ